MRSSVLSVVMAIALLGLFVLPARAQTLQNPDFEDWTDDDPDGWVRVESGDNEVRQSAFAYSGDSAVLIRNNNTTRPRVIQTFFVDPSQEVTSTAFVYDNDPSFTRMYIKVYDENGALLMQDFDESFNNASWQQLSVSFITPPDANNIRMEFIHFYNTGSPGPQDNYIDLADILITQPTYANIQNPGLEDWTDGEPDSWVVVETGANEVQQEGTEVNSGAFSASMTSTSFTRPRLVQLLSVRPGDTVTGRMQMLDNDPSLVRLYLRAYDTNGTLLQQDFGSASNSPSWQTVSATLTTPQNTAWVRFEIIQFYNNSEPGAQTVYVDDAEFEIDTYTYNVWTDNRWYFIGVPTQIDNAADRNADALFADDLGGNSTPTTWVMSRYNNVTGEYERFGNGDGDPLTEPADIVPGLGYFFVQAVEPGVTNPTLDVTSAQSTLGAPNTDVSQTIVGQTGGNNGTTMLANPFYGEYSLGNSVIEVGGSPSDWGDDGINGNIYTWDTNNIQYRIQLATSAILDSWEGFWVVKTTAGDADITFTYDNNNHGPGIDDIDDVWMESGWSLNLRVESQDGQYRDEYNELGTRDRSRDGYDGYDAFELTPPTSQYVSLAFVHNDWQEGTRFSFDYRDRDWTQDDWYFEVKARNLPGETFRLYWPNIEGLPAGLEFELYEVNEENNTQHPIGLLSEMDDYTFSVGNNGTEVQMFRIRAVNGNVTTDVEETAGAMPTEFGIHAAYPNPFNSQISIEMGMPQTGNATLKVYDVLGRQVAKLYSGELRNGVHTFNWDAEGHASGIYILRMSANGQVSHRKVTLLQ